MAGGLIDELFVRLGFQVDDKEVKGFDKNLKSTLQSATRFAAGVLATITVIDRMSMSLAKNNQNFISFNQQTGLALGNMQRIAQAGMLGNMNISPETVMQSMQAVQSNLAQIRLGQGNIEPYQLLGISPIGKDANQIFEDLRSAISGLDDMTATNIIQQMGFSPEMITVLRMTNSELEEMNGLMLSPEQRQSMQQYSLALRKVHMEFGLMKDEALLQLMPTLVKLEKGFMAIVEGATKIIEVFHNVYSSAGAMKPAFAALSIGALAAINPVAAAVLALYLILEDIAVWASGGKSALGTSFDILGEKFEGLIKWADGINKMFGDTLRIMREIIKIAGNPAFTGEQHGKKLREMFFDKFKIYPEQIFGGKPNTPYPASNPINNALDMNKPKNQVANLNHAQTINQNNYNSFGTKDLLPVTKTLNDSLWAAALQADGSR